MSRYAEVIIADGGGVSLLSSWPKVHTSGLSHDEMRVMLERASNLIDSKLGRRYDVPFAAPYPPRVRDLAIDLAMMDILYRSADPPTFVMARVTAALEALKALAEGEDSIVGADGGTIEESTGTSVLVSNTSGYTPVFQAVPSLNEGTDPDRGTDEADARGTTDGPFRAG